MPPRKFDHYIGIDPGTETGYAHWLRPAKNFFELDTVMIHRAMNRILAFQERGFLLFVRLEDARLRTWFGKTGPEVWKGAGSIMRDCRIWEDFLKDMSVPFELVPPRNNKTKVTHDYFTRLTGWTKPTNEHSRDAAMLVYGL